jgi:hypothetical protein
VVHRTEEYLGVLVETAIGQTGAGVRKTHRQRGETKMAEGVGLDFRVARLTKPGAFLVRYVPHRKFDRNPVHLKGEQAPVEMEPDRQLGGKLHEGFDHGAHMPLPPPTARGCPAWGVARPGFY